MAERSDQALDALDRALILALAEHPRVSILELARLLGVARNTVYARLERLQDRAVITGFGPDIDLRTLGTTTHNGHVPSGQVLCGTDGDDP